MENKLPEDFKKRWVEALRSGEFEQGKGILYNDNSNSYCCLGVACRVAGYSDELPRHNGEEYISPSALLVPELIRGYENGIAKTLAEMNDNNISFSQIADYIEQNL